MGVLEHAHAVLCAASPEAKIKAAQALLKAWDTHKHIGATPDTIPDRPARPSKPVTVPPRDVPRHGLGSVKGRICLLHAVAHIEFNAIDLAADLICRFACDPLIDNADRPAFIDDWVRVCEDEARHFGLINARLSELGASYGDEPAHDGLWEAAQSTAHDLSARLAIAPMVLEARGLDVSPGMIQKLKNVRDMESAAIMEIIYNDEIGHVAAGTKWFRYICIKMDITPEDSFKRLVNTHFAGALKPPFNTEARSKAGLSPSFYTMLG